MASSTIEPSAGAGGGVPRPRKLSDASVSTAHDSASATWTMITDEMFGRMCRNRMRGVLKPSTRDARTKSASRSASTGPRATRMKMGTYTMAMASATVNQVRVSADASARASSSGGNANSTFATPRIGGLTGGPKYPARTPAAVPTMAATATATTATISDVPAPAATRDRMSRPNWSVPNR